MIIRMIQLISVLIYEYIFYGITTENVFRDHKLNKYFRYYYGPFYLDNKSKSRPRVAVYTYDKPNVADEILHLTYYNEPSCRTIGRGHLACITYAGGRGYPRRKYLCYDENRVIQDEIKYRSYYTHKNYEDAVSLPTRFSSHLLSSPTEGHNSQKREDIHNYTPTFPKIEKLKSKTEKESNIQELQASDLPDSEGPSKKSSDKERTKYTFTSKSEKEIHPRTSNLEKKGPEDITTISQDEILPRKSCVPQKEEPKDPRSVSPVTSVKKTISMKPSLIEKEEEMTVESQFLVKSPKKEKSGKIEVSCLELSDENLITLEKEEIPISEECQKENEKNQALNECYDTIIMNQNPEKIIEPEALVDEGISGVEDSYLKLNPDETELIFSYEATEPAESEKVSAREEKHVEDEKRLSIVEPHPESPNEDQENVKDSVTAKEEGIVTTLAQTDVENAQETSAKASDGFLQKSEDLFIDEDIKSNTLFDTQEKEHTDSTETEASRVHKEISQIKSSEEGVESQLTQENENEIPAMVVEVEESLVKASIHQTSETRESDEIKYHESAKESSVDNIYEMSPKEESSASKNDTETAQMNTVEEVNEAASDLELLKSNSNDPIVEEPTSPYDEEINRKYMNNEVYEVLSDVPEES